VPRGAPVVASHNLTVLSHDAEARSRPSRENTTAETRSEWPLSVPRGVSVVAFHSLTVNKDTPSCILFVSRKDVEVQFQFRRLTETSSDTFFEYEISVLNTQNDVEFFSVNIVAENLPRKDSVLREEFTEKISQRCEGIFL
jgi:hypothetical protein